MVGGRDMGCRRKMERRGIRSIYSSPSEPWEMLRKDHKRQVSRIVHSVFVA
jgi:hypothetical protein